MTQQFLLGTAGRYSTVLCVIRPMIMYVVCVKESQKETQEEILKVTPKVTLKDIVIETPTVRSQQYMFIDQRDHTMKRNNIRRYFLVRNNVYYVAY